MRRFPLGAPNTSAGPNTGIIIAPPLVPGCPPAPNCPTIPGLAEWLELPSVLDCEPISPAQATIAGSVFTSTPGPDLTTTYQWGVDVSAIEVPYMCCVVFVDEAVALANIRSMIANGSYIQTQEPPYAAITSPFFVLRPGDFSPAVISHYQRNTSFGDTDNGLLATVRFRVLCLPVEPSA